MSIHTSLVFIDPGPGQGSKGSSNKLLSVVRYVGGQHSSRIIWSYSRYHALCYSVYIPQSDTTDTRSIHSFTRTLLEIGYCYRRHGPGISPSHNPIPKRFDQQGTNTVGSVNRKFGFTHYLYTLCCHGNTDISYIILLTGMSR